MKARYRPAEHLLTLCESKVSWEYKRIEWQGQKRNDNERRREHMATGWCTRTIQALGRRIRGEGKERGERREGKNARGKERGDRKN